MRAFVSPGAHIICLFLHFSVIPPPGNRARENLVVSYRNVRGIKNAEGLPCPLPHQKRKKKKTKQSKQLSLIRQVSYNRFIENCTILKPFVVEFPNKY